MKKVIITSVLFIMFTSFLSLNAQQWARAYGGRYAEDPWGDECLQKTRDGGFVFSCLTNSYGDQRGNLLVVKLSSKGEIEWQRVFLGNRMATLASIQQTMDGGYIVICNTYYPLNSASYYFWILRLTSNGDIEWQRIYGGGNGDMPYSVRQTSDGGYIVAGETRSFGSGGKDIWVLKLYSNGDIEWQRTYGGSNDEEPSTIQQTRDEGFVIAGWTNSFGAGLNDFWVLKLYSNGDIEWQRTYGGGGVENARSIHQTSDGGYGVAGFTSSFGVGIWDFWILKLNPNGDIEWQRTYGGSMFDDATSIQQTSEGGFIVAGHTFSFDAESGDICVLKLSPYGDIEWQRNYGGSYDEGGGYICQTNDYGYLLAGYTRSFGAGDNDILILDLNSSGDIDQSCENLIRTSNAIALDTYVLPQNTAITARFTNATPQAVNIAVQDINMIVTQICGATIQNPIISSLFPNSGPIGTPITISGSNFGSSQGTVTFNGVSAVISYWSNSEVKTSVPLGATTGDVIINTSEAKNSNGMIFTVVSVQNYADLSILKIRPVQAVYSSDINDDGKFDFVADKPTAVLVEVKIENPQYLNANDLIKTRIRFDGIDYFISKTANELTQNNTIVFYPLGPKNLGDQVLIAEIDPDNLIKESTETNNLSTLGVTVKKTNGLFLFYIPVNGLITGGGYSGHLDFDVYSHTVPSSARRIEATYPVAKKEFKFEKSENAYNLGSPYPGYLDDLLVLWAWGKLVQPKADRIVGIVPYDYFDYHHLSAVGLSFPGVKSVLSIVGDFDTPAHEVGHTYHLYNAVFPLDGCKEEYDCYTPGKLTRGYDVCEEEEITQAYCFMGSGSHCWICEDCYKNLFKEFRINKSDPEVLLLSGYVRKDGSVKLNNLYRSKNGILDNTFPGDYSVQILDKGGNVLTNLQFFTAFKAHIDPVGFVDTEVAAFTLSVPYVDNTSKLRIKLMGNTLIEINPNIKLLHDAIDSIPSSGFLKNADQRRNALHNKISEVEQKILERYYVDAINKLKNDIRDKFEKWLLDDYQKETPLQISKTEIIELVDEIISRLSKEL
jgi:hypothetical protein